MISPSRLNGSYDNSGEPTTNNYNGRGTVDIPVEPNTAYTLSSSIPVLNLRLHEYAEDKTYLGVSVERNTNTLTITTRADTRYLRWSLNYTNAEVVGEGILNLLQLMLNIGNTALPFEKYTNGQASPTPSSEQQVKMLTGNVSVEESNGNMLDARSDNYIPSGVSVSASVNENVITVVNGSLSSSRGVAWLIPVGTNRDITIKYSAFRYEGSDQYNNQVRYDFVNEPVTSFTPNIGAMISGTDKTVTVTPTGKYLLLVIRCGQGNTVIVDDLTVSYSSNPSWVAHEGQTFPLTLPEGMYLGDLGTASDFIFKNEKGSPYYNSSLTENANYWHKGWNKKIFDGSESWSATNTQPTDTSYKCYAIGITTIPDKKLYVYNQLSNFFIYLGNTPSIIANATESGLYVAPDTVRIGFISEIQTLEQFKSWLAEKYQAGTPVYLCYELATEENIPITDTTLNAQIDAMWEQMKTYGITNFVITGGDITGKLDLDYFVDDRIEQNQEIADIKSALLSLGANI